MAEQDYGTDEQLPEPDPDTDTAPEDEASPAADDGAKDERFTDEEPPDPNDPNYKYWQAAYTKTRQRDRERFGKVEQEHQQYGDVLRNFYQSDEYALQVLRQRFPQLADKLSLDGTSQGTRPTAPRSSGTPSTVEKLLQEHLGTDLAFLAPKLGAALETALQQAIDAAVNPLKEQTATQQAAARRREEDSLLAAMDSRYPGWEQRYGAEMQAIDAFLSSDELHHPKFGNKYELYYKLLNPDVARIDATRQMERTARNRLTTGRTGRQSQPVDTEQIAKARTNSEAFRLAAEAALRELGRSA